MRIRLFFSSSRAVVLTVLVLVGSTVWPMPANSSAVRKGELPPAVQWTDVDGETYNWDELRDEGVVVLAFWATWCSNCRKEWPDLLALQEEFAASKIRWASVNLGEDVAKVSEELTRRGEFGISLIDTSEENGKALGIKFVPTLLVLDQAGEVRFFGAPKMKKIRKLLASLATNLSPEGAQP